jgi:hypothetical protein
MLWMSLLPQAALAKVDSTFTLSSSDEHRTIGQTIEVSIRGENISDLYAYELSVSFNKDLWEFEKVSTELTGYQDTPNPELQSQGILKFAYTKIGHTAGENGNVLLGKVTFKAKAEGNSKFELLKMKLVDAKFATTTVTPNASKSVVIGNKSSPGNPSSPSSPETPDNPGIPSRSSVQGGVVDIVLDAPVVVNPATKTAAVSIDFETWNKALSQIPRDDSNKINVHLKFEAEAGAIAYEMKLPATALSSLKDNITVVMNTPLATISAPSSMFKNVGSSIDPIGIRVGKVDVSQLDPATQLQIDIHPIMDLALVSDGQTVPWSNPETPVLVSMDYTPTAEELKNPEHIVIWYVDGKGIVTPVPSGKYDPLTGRVSFTTTHFSTYAVNYVTRTFTDIADLAWAQHSIEVLAAKGIIDGVSEEQFQPTNQVSRADFVMMLLHTLGFEAELGERFADVPVGAYYDQALRIARGRGIVEGSGDNEYHPNESITREDMAVLTVRALHAAMKMPKNQSGATIHDYVDTTFIAHYALNQVEELVKSGLLTGYDQGIHPKEHTTRAQAAVLMYRIYNH